MTRQAKFIKYTITVIFLFIFSIMSSGGVQLHASALAYSDVLTDLKKDALFDATEYPEIVGNNKLEVIQIAESTDGELLIYVYQPSGKAHSYPATRVRLSQSIGENVAPYDFNLKRLNTNGVFSKYLVEDIEIKPDVVRYYSIISIYRKFDSNAGDDQTSEVNDVNEVTYRVAKRYTACTLEGNVSYSVIEESVIEIIPESKHIGYFEFFEGMGFIVQFSYADCWYVGFDTDKPIDELYEAEMSFKMRTVGRNYALSIQTSEDLGEWQEIKNYKIDGESKGSAGNGFLATKYEWNRIVSKDEFENDPNYKLTDEEKNNLNGCKWVLRFYETEKKVMGDYKTQRRESYEIADVTILRLKFETDGTTYNLGVVDNYQAPAPDQEPGNAGGAFGSVTSPFAGGCTAPWDIFKNLPTWQQILSIFAIIVCGIIVVDLLFLLIKPLIKSLFRRKNRGASVVVVTNGKASTGKKKRTRKRNKSK